MVLSTVIRDLKDNNFIVQGEFYHDVMLNPKLLKLKQVINKSIEHGEPVQLNLIYNVGTDFKTEDIH